MDGSISTDHGDSWPDSELTRRNKTDRTIQLAGSITPCYRSIVGVDIVASTERTNTGRAVLRRVMYDLVRDTMKLSGVRERYLDDLMDRGDGVFAFVHPVDPLPKPLLINTVIPTLSSLLAQHNTSFRKQPLRMRAVVHAGEVHNDGLGWFGEAIDLACRLLDAPELKRMSRETEADLVLVVSDDFYHSVVSQGYDGINPQDFKKIVRVRLGDVLHRGWVNVPRTPNKVVTDLETRRASHRSETR